MRKSTDPYCPTCNGEGFKENKEDSYKECIRCGGFGTIQMEEYTEEELNNLTADDDDYKCLMNEDIKKWTTLKTKRNGRTKSKQC